MGNIVLYFAFMRSLQGATVMCFDEWMPFVFGSEVEDTHVTAAEIGKLLSTNYREYFIGGDTNDHNIVGEATPLASKRAWVAMFKIFKSTANSVSVPKDNDLQWLRIFQANTEIAITEMFYYNASYQYLVGLFSNLDGSKKFVITIKWDGTLMSQYEILQDDCSQQQSLLFAQIMESNFYVYIGFNSPSENQYSFLKLSLSNQLLSQVTQILTSSTNYAQIDCTLDPNQYCNIYSMSKLSNTQILVGGINNANMFVHLIDTTNMNVLWTAQMPTTTDSYIKKILYDSSSGIIYGLTEAPAVESLKILKIVHVAGALPTEQYAYEVSVSDEYTIMEAHLGTDLIVILKWLKNEKKLIISQVSTLFQGNDVETITVDNPFANDPNSIVAHAIYVDQFSTNPDQYLLYGSTMNIDSGTLSRTLTKTHGFIYPLDQVNWDSCFSNPVPSAVSSSVIDASGTFEWIFKDDTTLEYQILAASTWNHCLKKDPLKDTLSSALKTQTEMDQVMTNRNKFCNYFDYNSLTLTDSQATALMTVINTYYKFEYIYPNYKYNPTNYYKYFYTDSSPMKLDMGTSSDVCYATLSSYDGSFVYSLSYTTQDLITNNFLPENTYPKITVYQYIGDSTRIKVDFTETTGNEYYSDYEVILTFTLPNGVSSSLTFSVDNPSVCDRVSNKPSITLYTDNTFSTTLSYWQYYQNTLYLSLLGDTSQFNIYIKVIDPQITGCQTSTFGIQISEDDSNYVDINTHPILNKLWHIVDHGSGKFENQITAKQPISDPQSLIDLMGQYFFKFVVENEYTSFNGSPIYLPSSPLRYYPKFDSCYVKTDPTIQNYIAPKGITYKVGDPPFSIDFDKATILQKSGSCSWQPSSTTMSYILLLQQADGSYDTQTSNVVDWLQSPDDSNKDRLVLLIPYTNCQIATYNYAIAYHYKWYTYDQYQYDDIPVIVKKNCAINNYDTLANAAQPVGPQSYILFSAAQIFDTKFIRSEQCCQEVVSISMKKTDGTLVDQSTMNSVINLSYNSDPSIQTSTITISSLTYPLLINPGIYQMSIESKVIEADGSSSDKKDFSLQLLSHCNLITMTAPVITTQDYFIQDLTHPLIDQNLQPLAQTLPSFTLSFLQSGVSIPEDQLLIDCGDIEYEVIDMTTQSTPDTSIFTLNTNPQGQIQIITYSENKDLIKGSSTPGIIQYQFVYKAKLKNFNNIQSQTTFTQVIRDPCFTIEIQPKEELSIPQLIYQQIKFPPITFTFGQFKEAVTLNGAVFENKNYCGPLKYDLLYESDLSQYKEDMVNFKFSQFGAITVQSNNLEYQEKTFDMILRVSVSNYLDYGQYIYKFKITFNPCQVNDVSEQPSIDDIIYLTKSGNITYKAKGFFQQQPDCKYKPIISSKWANGSNFNPKSIQFHQDGSTGELSWSINAQGIDDQCDEEAQVSYLIQESKFEKIIKFKIRIDFKIWPLMHDEPTFPNNNFPSNLTMNLGDVQIISSGIPTEDAVKVITSVDTQVSESIWKSFIKITIDEKKQEVTVKIAPTTKEQGGKYILIITLLDNGSDTKDGPLADEQGEPKEKNYTIPLIVQELNEENSKLNEIIFQNQQAGEEIKPVVVKDSPCIVDCVPIMQLQKISSAGEVEFTFDRDMVIPDKSEIEKWAGNFSYGSIYNKYKAIYITVEPGTKQEVKNLDLNFTVIEFQPQQLKLQLDFSEAIYISMAESKDKIFFQIKEPQFFVESKYGYSVEKLVYTQFLTQQMVPGNATKALVQTAESVEQSMNGALFGNLATNLIMSGSLQFVWGMINSLQIIFHMPGNNVNLPGNANLVYGKLTNIVQFNLIPSDYLQYFYFWNYLVGEDYSLSQQSDFDTRILQETDEQIDVNVNDDHDYEETNLSNIGYETIAMIDNLETIMVFILFYLLLIMIMIMFKCLSKLRFCSCFQKPYNYLKNALLWNVVIRFLQESYLELAIVCLINFRFQTQQNFTFHNSLSYKAAFLISFILLLFPFYIIWFFSLKEEDDLLSDKQLVQTYGSLFEGLKIIRKTGVSYYSVFTIRRLMFAIVLLQFEDYGWFQIQLCLAIQTFMIIYLGYIKPWDNPFLNKLELFNEFSTIIIVYHLACFTEFYQNIEFRYYGLGNSFIYLTFFIIGVNMIVLLLNFKHQIYVQWRRRKIRNRYQSQRKYLMEVMKEGQERTMRYNEIMQKRIKQQYIQAIKDKKRTELYDLFQKKLEGTISVVELQRMEVLQNRRMNQIKNELQSKSIRPLAEGEAERKQAKLMRKVGLTPVQEEDENLKTEEIEKAVNLEYSANGKVVNLPQEYKIISEQVKNQFTCDVIFNQKGHGRKLLVTNERSIKQIEDFVNNVQVSDLQVNKGKSYADRKIVSEMLLIDIDQPAEVELDEQIMLSGEQNKEEQKMDINEYQFLQFPQQEFDDQKRFDQLLKQEDNQTLEKSLKVKKGVKDLKKLMSGLSKQMY